MDKKIEIVWICLKILFLSFVWANTRRKNKPFRFLLSWHKGSFTNYVHKILAFFDHLPPTTHPPLTFSMVWMLTESGHFWTTYLPRLVNLVGERPLTWSRVLMSHSAHCTELSTVCSKINGINFHGLETDKSNSVRLCSYCWAYNIFHLGMAAIRNFCTGLIALVARFYEVETSEIRFNYLIYLMS